MNSVPFNADGSNNALGTTLGLWTLTNTASVTTGNGGPFLASKVLRERAVRVPCSGPVHRERVDDHVQRRDDHLGDGAEPGRQPAVRAGQRDAGPRRERQPVDLA